MHDIQKYGQIDSTVLIRQEYFESLLIEASDKGVIDQDRMTDIQLGLLTLLSRNVDRYTSKESSSVRVEDAESILKSINYTISMALKAAGDAEKAVYMINTEDIQTIYSKGIEVINKYFENAKLISDKLRSDDFSINNYAYRDTVHKGIPMFFSFYDRVLAASESAGSIDYPLSFDNMDISGVEYIYEYLYHLSLENSICRRFSPSEIESLMKCHSKHYKEDLINVYELVLSNLIGRSLLGYGIEELDIDNTDIVTLEKQLEKMISAEIDEKLYLAFEQIMCDMNITDDYDRDYLKKALPDLAFRIKHNLSVHKLQKIFISISGHQDTGVGMVEDSFVDGVQMEDEELRNLIDEISDCKNLKNKVSIVRDNVKSIADLVEILEVCFFEGEYIEVFKLLDTRELIVIKHMIEEEKKQNFLIDSLNYEDSWKGSFMQYIQNMRSIQ
jgi:hypothetical protein